MPQRGPPHFSGIKGDKMTRNDFYEIPKRQKLLTRERGHLEDLENKATDVSVHYGERVQTSRTDLNMLYATEAADVSRRIDRLEREQQRAVANAAELIAGVSGENARHVLELRYVACCEWRDICSLVGYSYRQVRRYHSAGMNELFPAV